MTTHGTALASAMRFPDARLQEAPLYGSSGGVAGAAAAPAPAPSATFGSDGPLLRTLAAGGALATLFQHPSFQSVENLWRKLAEQAMFTATPEQPFKFELGAFVVPRSMAFLISDFRFSAHRLSGAAVGDTVPLEPERLSTLFAFDLTIANKRQATLRMEIDPTAINVQKEAFFSSQSGGTIFPASGTGGRGLAPTVPAQFNLARSARSVEVAGAGLSALPNRTRRLGPRNMPFTQIAKEGERVQGTCTIFRAVPIPLAFFELDLAGFLMSRSTMDTMLAGLKPATEQSGPVR